MKKLKKPKVSKEDKSFIADTVNTLAAMRISGTMGDDTEEMNGLLGHQNGSRFVGNQQKSNETMWKTLAFVMFGILMLFATDVIEFKKHSNHSNKSSSSNQLAEDEIESAVIGGSVKLKTAAATQSVPAPLPAPVPQPETPSPTEKATPPPTANPTANPTDKATSQPTNNPTAKATDKATSAPETKKAVQSNDLGTEPLRHTYTTRGQPMSDEDRKAMEDKWGKWTLEADAKDRPEDDYYAAYPNRDIPREKFPSNAWQKDKEWLSKFLPESINLVNRAINAIHEEYGEPTDGTSDLFHVEKHDTWIEKMDKHHCKDQSGCTTAKSFENLKRRLLHAVMTEDKFIFAMGGHSSAAGHGNHFTQSYTLQVQWILEGVFSRLGIRHQSRNVGLGGLGTVQTGMATKQILGHDVDVLMWDSGTSIYCIFIYIRNIVRLLVSGNESCYRV